MRTDAAPVLASIKAEAHRRGVRWTSQRTAVVETFLQAGGHLSVEEVLRRVRRIDRSISPATIYRTVNLLVEMGVVQKRQFAPGSASFEWALDREHHDHLVCVGCGAIQEFHHQAIEDLQEQVAREYGFTLQHHRLELFGLCRACQEQQRPAAAKPRARSRSQEA